MEENRSERFENSAPDANVASDSIKCKGCGSNLTFDPASQKLKCGYCGYTEDFLQSADVDEIPIEATLRGNESWRKETLVFKCENCGAQIVADKAETAILCPFCGTSHIVPDEELEGIRPSAVVPFQITKEKLAEKLNSWAKKKIFAPKKFKQMFRPDKIKGVFLPFFTFDSHTDSVYDGVVGYTRTRTVHTSHGTETETYTEWKSVSGTIEHFFDDVLINAGKRFEKKKLSKLNPFDWDSIRVYENKFLSGYVAHHYERDIQTCWDEAKEVIDGKIRNMIVERYGCDEVKYLNVSTRHSGVTYKYVLLPVYVINFSFKNKNFVLYANGSTGKIVGRAPVSPVRASIAGVIGGILVTALIIFIWWFLNR